MYNIYLYTEVLMDYARILPTYMYILMALNAKNLEGALAYCKLYIKTLHNYWLLPNKGLLMIDFQHSSMDNSQNSSLQQF